jgi:acyl-CoA synthetase (AMP-forming)/AMP-acid ligase II
LLPTIESVTAYLIALAAGHADSDRERPVVDHRRGPRPDSIGRIVGGSWTLEHARKTSVHTLHPDLALLLSTSGSTGSPKLVRLSWGNLTANTSAIVRALGLGPQDVGVTTLPLHYCYGLSVLHTHLAVGAAMVLTDLSVADDDLWPLLRTTGVTSLSGVPHTFDLLTAARRWDVPTSTSHRGGRCHRRSHGQHGTARVGTCA